MKYLIPMLILALCGFTVQEKIGEDVLCDYTIDNIDDVHQAEGRDIYVDGQLYNPDSWYDYETMEPKIRRIIKLMVSEINTLRELHGLQPRTKAQVIQALKEN